MLAIDFLLTMRGKGSKVLRVTLLYGCYSVIA
jgi:hypothetical protein